MVRFEDSREKKKAPRGRPRKGESRGRSYGDSPRGRRPSSRGSSRGRGSDIQMTKVTCSECGAECEVPFKPKSNKPLFCDACFAKRDKPSSNKSSNRDLDIINEKLNKIMKALKIE